jgi:hypothetical protein
LRRKTPCFSWGIKGYRRKQQGILKLKAEGFTVSASGGKRNSRPVSGLVAAVEAGSPRL